MWNGSDPSQAWGKCCVRLFLFNNQGKTITETKVERALNKESFEKTY